MTARKAAPLVRPQPSRAIAPPPSLSTLYAERERELGGACPLQLSGEGGYCGPIGRPFTQLLADDECPHGRLPGDRTPACGCWRGELL